MRAWVAVVVSLLAACGTNPAFGNPASATATATSEAPPAATSTTEEPPGPTTSEAPASGVESTGAASTTAMVVTTATTTNDATDAGTSTGAGTGTTDVGTGASTGASTGGAPGVGECPDDASLIACYRFEDDVQGGSLFDGSMYGHHGGRANTNAVDSVAGFARAVDLLPGSDVHVVHDPDFAPGRLTLAALVFVKDGQVNKGLIDRAGSYRLFLADGVVKCRVRTDQGEAEVAFDIDVERWYHLACTFDGATLRLHGHGLRFNPTPAQANLGGEVSGDPSEFIVGRVAGDDSTKYVGWMDQVLLFDRALDAEEVCELAGPLCAS